jgi:hypothetical protein
MRIAPVVGVFVFTSPLRETSPTLFQNDFEIKRRRSDVRRRLQLTRIIGSDLPRNGRDAAPPVELSRFSDEFVRRVSPVCRWFPPSCSGRNELPDNPSISTTTLVAVLPLVRWRAAAAQRPFNGVSMAVLP